MKPSTIEKITINGVNRTCKGSSGAGAAVQASGEVVSTFFSFDTIILAVIHIRKRASRGTVYRGKATIDMRYKKSTGS